MTDQQPENEVTSAARATFSLSRLVWSDLEEFSLPAWTGIDEDHLVSEIIVRERNFSLRYSLRDAENTPTPEGSIPGQLELELRSRSEKEIDTIVISQLTPESLGRTLDAILEYDVDQSTSGMSHSDETILPLGKLKHILETARAHYANVDSKLGVSPTEIAIKYFRSLRIPLEEEDRRERVLRINDPVVTYFVISNAFELARDLSVTKALVHAATPTVVSEVNHAREDQGIIWIVGKGESIAGTEKAHDLVYASQNPELSKDAQVRLALFSALIRGFVDLQERVLCFSGSDNSPHLDKVSLQVPGREFTWINPDSLKALQSVSANPVLERVINLALRFSIEGKESKKIGASFIIGDPEELDSHLNQPILNPFLGHPEESRSVLNDTFLESLREFASIDGAVVIRPDGIAERAGTYLVAPTDKIKPKQAWGARHISAAALSSVTKALGVVISESSGDITVMWDGKPILDLPSGSESVKKKKGSDRSAKE